MRIRVAVSAVLFCALVGLLAATARAGDAVRLLVELPPDIGAIGPGETVPVQVVGEDADGARVGFGGLSAVLVADEGRVSVVKAPYNFTYQAPAAVDGVLEVRLRAHIEGAETVRGSTVLRVVIPGDYVQLHLTTPRTRLDFGGEAPIEVLGEKRTGQRVPVVDRQVSVSVEGSGTVEFVRLSHFRYRAAKVSEGLPPGRRVWLRATLVNQPEVKGSLELVVGRATPPRTTGPRSERPPERPERPRPAPPVEPPRPAPTPPASSGTGAPTEPASAGGGTGPDGTPPPSGERPKRSPEGEGGVVWPGGHLQIAVWRTKDALASPWSTRKRKLPPAGKEFIAPSTYQKIRARVLSADVTRATHEWWIGEKTNANVRTDGPGEEGRVRVARNKHDRLTAHVEARVPDNDQPLHVVLLLHMADGKVVRQPLVLRKGRDRDRDGVLDPPDAGGDAPK